MAKDELRFITEDWRKEYEKFLLSKKYDRTTTIVAYALANPTIENIKRACAAVNDYISMIPIGNDDELKQERKALLDRVDKIYTVLYGDYSNPEVLKLIKEFGLSLVETRKGVQRTFELVDLPKLAIKLRDVLTDAGDFAMSLGLRVTHAIERKIGIQKVLEEEGFEDLEVE